jgi:hypothetical protein
MPTRSAKLALALIVILSILDSAHSQNGREADQEFGPVVRAYLGYLRNEQEVVDDRASRREISSNYYRRNSNRIKALRQMAIRLARETNNDYLPELEAVAVDEFGLLFERPRPASSFKVGEVVNNTFRFLGTVRSVEMFYLFARLDPYEQAELNEKNKVSVQKDLTPTDLEPKTVTRTRRVVP